jgi:hypothetical protein
MKRAKTKRSGRKNPALQAADFFGHRKREQVQFGV